MARSALCSPASSLVAPAGGADDKVFSGPQVGEKLPPFKVRGVFDDDAGKELDFVKQADGKPIVLVFVHDVNRPSIGMTRVLTNYTAEPAEGRAGQRRRLAGRRRHRGREHAQADAARAGQGRPDRHLARRQGRAGRLRAEPQRHADDPGRQGGQGDRQLRPRAAEHPGRPAEDPRGGRQGGRRRGAEARRPDRREGACAGDGREPDAKLPGLLRAVIQKTADQGGRRQGGRGRRGVHQGRTRRPARRSAGSPRTIVEGGKLDDYGTAPAQEYLTKWAKEYGGERSRRTRRRTRTTDEAVTAMP